MRSLVFAVAFWMLAPLLSVHPSPSGDSLTWASPQLSAQEVPEEEPPPKKLALIIAIAGYPVAETGVSPINSDNDVPLLRAALMAQGFDSTGIRVLHDSQATRDGMVSAVREHLVSQLTPGDVAFLHYSGHGHQITDDNGDELDGYDEVLVPFDAPAHPPEGYDGHLHLRDDELGELLDEIQAAVGPDGNVVFSLDACFSGSATRGLKEVAVRGFTEPIGPPASAATRGGAEGGGGLIEGGAASTRSVGSSAAATPYVVISAARHDEPSWEAVSPEGLPVGSLSLALSQALAEAAPGTTYRHLFDMVKKKMAVLAPLQTPQMEGQADGELFSGHLVGQAPYLEVLSVAADSVVLLRGGVLLGIFPGTRFSLFPPGTRDPAEADPIASGTVSRINALRSEVILDEAGDPAALKDAWAFITMRALGEFKAVVLPEALSGEEHRKLESAVRGLGTVALGGDDPALVLRPDESSDSLVLLSTWDNARILGPFSRDSDGWVREVVQHARSYAVNRLLAQIEMDSPRMDVELEIVPALHELDLDGACAGSEPLDPASIMTSGGQIELAPGDGYLLRLTNHGDIGAYVSVLDLMPNGDVGQLFPLPNLTGEDNYLEPGTSHLVSLCYEVTEPLGLEILKLFATRERVDFYPIVASASLSRGAGPLSPLEEVFADAFSGTRSGVSPRAIASGRTQTTIVSVVARERKERR